MDFGSKFVYVYDRSDEESVSDDSVELDDESEQRDRQEHARPQRLVMAGRPNSRPKSTTGIASKLKGVFRAKSSRSKRKSSIGKQASTSGGPVAPQLPASDEDDDPQPSSWDEKKVKVTKKRAKVRKADPNILTLNIGNLVTPENVQTGQQSVKCSSCPAMMTGVSQMNVDAVSGRNCWRCEFCDKENVDTADAAWHKPSADDITYLLESAPAADEGKLKTDDDCNIIFVIDISGSMGATQHMDHTNSNGRVTRSFVSRLDAVKTAAEHQIRNLKQESPNACVGLVAFGTAVKVYGDGSKSKVTLQDVAGKGTSELYELGHQQQALQPLHQTFNKVTSKLMSLEVEGMTALGPALLVAIAMASSKKGSKVIICTDGCANVGVGQLPDNDASEEEITECRAQYRSFGEYARDCGVTVSVTSLTGTDCRLVHLGLVSQLTGGCVDIVDQSNLTDQFGNILSSRTLATDVCVTVCLPQSLYVRDSASSEQQSVKTERIGNVAGDTDLIIEFGVRSPGNENEDPVPMEVEDQQGEKAGASQNRLTELPFQVQVEFTTRDGTKYLRVKTVMRQSTSEREVAESEMNIDVVGAAASKTVSGFALAGHHKQARHNIAANLRLARRCAPTVRDDEEDLLCYEDQLGELSELVEQQRHSSLEGPGASFASSSLGAAGAIQGQHHLSDDLASAYIQRNSKASAYYASKKKGKSK